MGKPIRVVLAGLFCVGAAAGAVTLLVNPVLVAWRPTDQTRHADRGPSTSRGGRGGPESPTRLSGRSSSTSSWKRLKTAATRPPSGSWPRSATWVRSRSCVRRSGGEVAGESPAFDGSYEQLHLDSPPTREQTPKKLSLEQSIGLPVHVRGQVPRGRVVAREGA